MGRQGEEVGRQEKEDRGPGEGRGGDITIGIRAIDKGVMGACTLGKGGYPRLTYQTSHLPAKQNPPCTLH